MVPYIRYNPLEMRWGKPKNEFLAFPGQAA